MAKAYSTKELRVINFLIRKYGYLTYVKMSILEEEYYQLTGVHRASGAIYMAAWRLENGYYDHLLPVA